MLNDERHPPIPPKIAEWEVWGDQFVIRAKIFDEGVLMHLLRSRRRKVFRRTELRQVNRNARQSPGLLIN